MKRKIGKTGIEVNAIGLGGMPLSIQNRPPEEQGLKVIQAAVDAGVNFIDSANVYCLDDNDIGHNEKLICKALKETGALNRVTIATKGGLTRPQGRWECDARPEKLRAACEKSLRDLEVETITLYQLHAPDNQVPFEDSVGALAKLQEEGKILHIGLSNVSANELNQAQNIVRIESVQNRCNPTHTIDFENGLVELCKEQEVTYIPYSPMGGGFGHKDLYHNETLKNLAQKYKASRYCIILAWLLAKGDHVLPIPGASRIESATDSPRAQNIHLDIEDIEKIDSI